MTGLGLLLAITSIGAKTAPLPTSEPKYLVFQIFVGAPGTASQLNTVTPPSEINATVHDVIQKLGTKGTDQRRLGFALGLLAFDHSDAQIRALIRHGFEIAMRDKVAIAFHIDDSMFWGSRSDLVRDPDNIEWSDWAGSPSRGRSLEWGPQPTKAPPQMCFNAPAIRKEVARRAKDVFGAAVVEGQMLLHQAGKDDLFAGVIAGSETQIGNEYGSRQPLGFHALANRGFSSANPPADLDAERESIVQEFIELWAKNLAAAGVPTDRIYSHTAFQPGANSKNNHFAPPGVAFGMFRRPGFSTYPESGFFEGLDAALKVHKSPHWASCEGTNYLPGSGESGITMETYLGRMFNHGASLVNVYAWGIGGPANKAIRIRIATERPEAISAYRKFLKGETLREPTTPARETLPDKIHRMQRDLPAWVERTHRPDLVQPLIERLDAAIKAGQYADAERFVDQILKLIHEPG